MKKKQRVAGIEPAWPAWKAGTLPLSYTREASREVCAGDGSVNGYCVHSTYLWEQIHADGAIHGQIPSPRNHQRESGSNEENWKLDGLEA